MSQTTCQQLIRDEGKLIPCDRPIHDTAYACPRCVGLLERALTAAAGQWRHAQECVARQTRISSVGATHATTKVREHYGPYCADSECGHRSCDAIAVAQYKAESRARNETPIPHETAGLLNLHALEDSWAIGNTVTTWARHIAEESGRPVDYLGDAEPAAMRYTAEHLVWLVHRPEAEQAWDELWHACTSLEHLIDLPAAARYVGPCEVCGRDLYAKPFAEDVECRPCGISYKVEDRRRFLMAAIEDRLVRASEAAHILPGFGVSVTRKQIDMWAYRKRIVPRAHDALERPLYLVADLLEVANNTPGRARA